MDRCLNCLREFGDPEKGELPLSQKLVFYHPNRSDDNYFWDPERKEWYTYFFPINQTYLCRNCFQSGAGKCIICDKMVDGEFALGYRDNIFYLRCPSCLSKHPNQFVFLPIPKFPKKQFYPCLSWKIQRLFFIALLKNNKDDCLLGMLPPEIFPLIFKYLATLEPWFFIQGYTLYDRSIPKRKISLKKFKELQSVPIGDYSKRFKKALHNCHWFLIIDERQNRNM